MSQPVAGQVAAGPVVGKKDGAADTCGVELAAERGLPVSVVQRRELSFDVDRPDDILTLLADGRRGRTREVCLQMDLGARLRA